VNSIAKLAALIAGLVIAVSALARWLRRRPDRPASVPPPAPSAEPEVPTEAPPPAPPPVELPETLAASWRLVPCLVQLRSEIDQLCPDRDRASDGTIGDAAHRAAVSDHNDDEAGRVPTRDADRRHEVHAVDIDDDLREPGVTMQEIVDVVVDRHRRGADNRLTYVIYNRRIWAATRGWTGRGYDGVSPHTEHAHFSASYVTSREADTRPFGILEEIVTQADRDDIVRRTTAAVIAALEARGHQSDGSLTSIVGRAAFDQGIPQDNEIPTRAKPRWPAWRVISDTRRLVLELSAKVDALSARSS
jgi:hypothetical protein